MFPESISNFPIFIVKMETQKALFCQDPCSGPEAQTKDKTQSIALILEKFGLVGKPCALCYSTLLGVC